MLINLNDLVLNSSSNNEGHKLFTALDNGLKTANEIVLVVSNNALLSSSFLNSSIGEFMDKHGIDTFKTKVKIKGSRSQFNRVVDYLEKYSILSKA